MVGSGLLAATAVVSGISGFFDGQLGREDLGAGHVVGQIVFVTVAWATAVVAAVRLWRLSRLDGQWPARRGDRPWRVEIVTPPDGPGTPGPGMVWDVH